MTIKWKYLQEQCPIFCLGCRPLHTKQINKVIREDLNWLKSKKLSRVEEWVFQVEKGGGKAGIRRSASMIVNRLFLFEQIHTTTYHDVFVWFLLNLISPMYFLWIYQFWIAHQWHCQLINLTPYLTRKLKGQLKRKSSKWTGDKEAMHRGTSNTKGKEVP